MMSCLLLPNSSARVFAPRGVSKKYGFSTFTQGRARRSALSASRARVNSFSLASRSLRAASHSFSETILCVCMMNSTVGGRAQRLSGDRSHPADTGAAGLAQDGDAADTRNVEEWLHELGAGLNRLGDALIHVVDREIGHPAFLHAVEFRFVDWKRAGDRLAFHHGTPIGAAVGHGHRRESPADGFLVEFLGALHVARHQFVPAERAVRAATWSLGMIFVAWFGCSLSHVLLLCLRKITFELVEAASPPLRVAVACGLVKELLVDESEERACALGFDEDGHKRLALGHSTPRPGEH